MGSVLAAVLCLYLLTAPPGFHATDGAVREFTAQNILTRHSVVLSQIDEGLLDEGFGRAGVGGHYYSHFGIGQSLLEIPFLLGLRVLEMTGLHRYFTEAGSLPMLLLMASSSALAAAFVYGTAAALGYRRRAALAAALLAATGSVLWGLSRQSYDVVQEAMGVSGALYAAITARQTEGWARRWRLALGGLAYGLALITRMSAAMAAPGLALLLLAPLRPAEWQRMAGAVLWFGVGVASIFWVELVYNWLRFGSLLDFGYGTGAPYPGGPLLAGLAQWLVSPWRGVLVYIPVLLALPLVAGRFAQRHGVVAATLALNLAAYLVLYGQYTGLGLTGWGPYYLLPASLPLFVPLAAFFEEPRAFPRWQRVTIGVLAAASVAVQLPSLSVPTERYQLEMVFAGVHVNEARVWEVRWCPLWTQTRATVRNFANLRQAGRYLGPLSEDTLEARFAEAAPFNLPDWWWLIHLLRGGQTGLIVPLLAAVSAAWAAAQLGKQAEVT